MAQRIVIGTRASKLALAQAALVSAALQQAWPGLSIHLEHIITRGDIILDRPLSAIGGKGLFVTEFEQALRAGRIDMAVHSAKDLPAELPPDMALPALPARASPLDALVARAGLRLAELPAGARVGTGSLRRACQLRAQRPDLRVADLRGNVDTRLRKLRAGEYDAIVLAAAGLQRLGLAHEASELLPLEVMLPAAGQGALAIEARAGDAATAALLAPLDDRPTRLAVLAERAFLAQIGGGCHVPVAAYAELAGDTLQLRGLIGARAGQAVRGAHRGPADDPAGLGRALASALLAAGGRALLREQIQ